MVNPTDYNTYVTSAVQPAPDVRAAGTQYPLWMYHPTKPAVVVADQAAQNALVAGDSQWTPTNPNATT